MTDKSKKYLNRFHKKTKKRVKFFIGHSYLVPVATFFAVVFFGLGMFVTLGATTGGANDTRIVNVFVDGENQTYSTRAKTVGDLLIRLEIPVIDEDIIEPAKDVLILENNTQINIYRARPVEVIEGDRSITVLSAQRAPRLLAVEAGLKLLPEDKVELTTRDSSILDSSASEQLTVDRSVEIKLTVYGVLTTFRTTSDTIEELLNEKGIFLEENETVQPADVNTKIGSGILISVNKPGVKTVAVIETIGFETDIESDPNLEIGKTEIKTAGVLGEKTVIYEITEENGIETSRNEIQSVITRNPVVEIKTRGSKQATLNSNISVSDDKIALMAAAGISPGDYAYVDYIVTKESRWRPGAMNASSGAYGLCQSMPASKMASAGDDYLTNPVTQLRWCNSYAGRYGGWQGSYNAWLAQNWW